MFIFNGLAMENNEGFIFILSFFLRIVGLIVCTQKAEELNRSKTGWGIFGFISPLLAMIWIQFMKPIIKWHKE